MPGLNIGDEARTFDSSSQTLYDAAGKKYSADGEAGIYLGDSKSFLEEINPGNSVKGIVVFDVPKSGFTATKIELHDSALSGGAEVAPSVEASRTHDGRPAPPVRRQSKSHVDHALFMHEKCMIAD